MSVSIQPGRHGVDRDAAPRHLDGGGLRERDQPGLRGRVVGLPGLARSPTTEEMLTIRPERARIIGFSARRVRRNAAVRFGVDHRGPLLVAERRGQVVAR